MAEELKVELVSISSKYPLDPNGGPIELRFENKQFGLYYSDVVKKGTPITDNLIETLRLDATKKICKMIEVRGSPTVGSQSVEIKFSISQLTQRIVEVEEYLNDTQGQSFNS